MDLGLFIDIGEGVLFLCFIGGIHFLHSPSQYAVLSFLLHFFIIVRSNGYNLVCCFNVLFFTLISIGVSPQPPLPSMLQSTSLFLTLCCCFELSTKSVKCFVRINWPKMLNGKSQTMHFLNFLKPSSNSWISVLAGQTG